MASMRVSPAAIAKTRPNAAIVVQNRIGYKSKRKTGGSGNNDDEPTEQKIRKYNIGMLHRCFYPQPEVTLQSLTTAMCSRWGHPYRCNLIKVGDFAAVEFKNEAYTPSNHMHKTDMMLVLEVLNTHSLGTGFVDFIKYDTTALKDPQHAECIVSLNIPTSGFRLSEWEIHIGW